MESPGGLSIWARLLSQLPDCKSKEACWSQRYYSSLWVRRTHNCWSSVRLKEQHHPFLIQQLLKKVSWKLLGTVTKKGRTTTENILSKTGWKIWVVLLGEKRLHRHLITPSRSYKGLQEIWRGASHKDMQWQGKGVMTLNWKRAG